jgi:hypothetical protein
MRTSPSRSTIADRPIRLATLLACLTLLAVGVAGACRSLADKKEGPSSAEIEAAKARVDRVREIVIENQLQSDDDSEKDFWLSILERLGDYRAELSRKTQR